jgi:single-stranded DNA-binding protein
MYETAGKLKWIGTTQSFASGFTKREFVVTTAADKYPQDLKFEVVKDKCPLLDPFELGNEYNGKYFVNLACWKIQAGGAPAGPSGGAREPSARQSAAPDSNEPSAADLRGNDDFDDDESPF